MLPISDFKYQTNKRRESSDFSWSSFGIIKIKFMVLLAVVLAALFGTQLVFATNLSTDGQALSQIESEIQNQETENLKLRTKIAEVSSFKNLSQEAQKFGFVKPDKIIAP